MLNPLRLDIAALTEDPVDIALIRAHCNVDEQTGTLNDELLRLYMRSAIVWAEGEMHRTIYARSGHRWVLKDFPVDDCGEIRLPRGKTQSVESIVYKSGGVPVTLTGPSASPAGSDFQQDLNSDDGGLLMPPTSGSWPSADTSVPDPVVITFTAGWTARTVPPDILHALLFYVSDAFELRGTDDIQNGRYKDIRQSMISGYCLHRWYPTLSQQ